MSSDVNEPEKQDANESNTDTELQQALAALDLTPKAQETTQTEETPKSEQQKPATDDSATAAELAAIRAENQRLQLQMEDMRSMLLGGVADEEPLAPEPSPAAQITDEQWEQLTPAQQRRFLKEEIKTEIAQEMNKEVSALREKDILPIQTYLRDMALYQQASGLIARVGKPEFDRLAPRMAEIAQEKGLSDVEVCYKLARAEELEKTATQYSREQKKKQARAASEKPADTATGSTKLSGTPTEDEITEAALNELPPEVRAALTRG